VKSKIGDFVVQCNDRAPARRMDERDGSGKQRTHCVRFGKFVDYIKSRDVVECVSSTSGTPFDEHTTPFYANGMRIFSDDDYGELLAEAFPAPYFTRLVDETEMLIQLTLDQVTRVLRIESMAPVLSKLYASVSSSLNKLFVGPKGTITRLHYDAKDAHAWLGQVAGVKLFIFYPPSDTKYLYPIEDEDSHSHIDPLDPDYEKYPLFRHAKPRVVVLRPGEIVLNPRRWWHYAVSLTPSITVMRNFYNTQTNSEALVTMIATMVRNTVGNAASSATTPSRRV
jgi:hypothetical protein